MLLTVLGELVMPNGDSVWTSSLLYVLTRLGIEEQTARQAIARGASAGWITGHRSGREVQWKLTEAGRHLIEAGAKRVYSMSEPAGRWDGNWLILLVTIPQSQRSVRKKLYGALSWEGFGNPTPGVWLSPHPDRRESVQQVIDDFGLRESTLAFVGSSLSIGLTEDEIVQKAWDFDEVTAKYEQLLIRFSGLQPEPGDPLLLSHLQLVSEWQRFPFMDPQLPEELLPNWIGRRAAVVCTQLRNRWYDDAQRRWREVVKETSPG
ncbi:PaaX family transcriptional regulator [Streptomyces sp. RB6PN25]|uniref:PaaX family transcriptional regulator n=1 Tax=Streptomyces humicola TaxID=2953240 RepID=A0ABT1PSZ0_9ACTN|nr:PaaX family transcriptional regulator C-terminal domain-containing protein [Streptomyces humicola]MCQ4080784.1 PaaX family transcriptional regulator [Streptomyces humicola]